MGKLKVLSTKEPGPEAAFIKDPEYPFPSRSLMICAALATPAALRPIMVTVTSVAAVSFGMWSARHTDFGWIAAWSPADQ